MLRKSFKDKKLQFFTFVMDEGEHGHLGYMASARRMDVARMMMEFLARSIPEFNRLELLEMCQLLEKEMETGNLNPSEVQHKKDKMGKLDGQEDQ